MSALGLYILLVFGIVGVPAPHGSRYCYSCQDVKDPDNCHIVHRCHHDQFCGAETRYHNGHYQLDLRCFDHHECDHSVDQVGEVIVGRRATHPLQCRKCCHGDRCNKHLCGIQHSTSTTPGTTCRNHEEDGITCASLADLNLCKAADGTASYLATKKCPLYCGMCTTGSGTTGSTDTLMTDNANSYTKCFSCENVRHLSQCTREVTCHHDQFCGTWAGVDHEGRISYWLGCFERPECEHHDEHNHNECTECCSSIHCNNRNKCTSFIAAHDPDYHTTQPTTKAPVVTSAKTKAPTTTTRAPTVTRVYTAATTQAPTVATQAPTNANTKPAITTRAPSVATQAPTNANTNPAITTRAPTVATQAPTVSHTQTTATTRDPTVATLAPTDTNTNTVTATTTHAPTVATHTPTGVHANTATTTKAVTDMPHTTGDNAALVNVTVGSAGSTSAPSVVASTTVVQASSTKVGSAGSTSAPSVVARTTVVQASSTKVGSAGSTSAPSVVASTTVVQASSTRVGLAGSTTDPIVVDSTTVVQASSTRAPGACYDDEKNGFSCSSLDAFNFCTDTSSFAHPLAVERCPKHCGFCS